jgi:predicted neuraminidase
MVDTPNFPDCNTTMFIDADDRLWLFWPTILDNTWDSCLTHYLVSEDYLDDGPITWNWHDVILLAPKDFPKKMLKALSARIEVEDRPWPTRVEDAKRMQHRLDRIGDKLFNRLGWQPRCKPTVLPSGRILLPLYSDTYDASIMAVSDDRGKSWYASDPLIGFGNIQPTVLRRKDGTLVAYMRENGPLDRIRTCASADDGITWGTVGVSDLPNPGAGVDGLVLESGKWLLIYNDTTRGRSSLAVSLSGDEGKTWKWTRHLEKHESGAYHYPAIIQGRDETLHAVYSYFVNKDGKEGKSMKHAAFNEAWIMGDDD